MNTDTKSKQNKCAHKVFSRVSDYNVMSLVCVCVYFYWFFEFVLPAMFTVGNLESMCLHVFILVCFKLTTYVLLKTISEACKEVQGLVNLLKSCWKSLMLLSSIQEYSVSVACSRAGWGTWSVQKCSVSVARPQCSRAGWGTWEVFQAILCE